MKKEGFDNRFGYTHLQYILELEERKYFKDHFMNYFFDTLERLVNSDNEHISYVLYVGECPRYWNLLEEMRFDEDNEVLQRLQTLLNKIRVEMTLQGIGLMFI